MQITGTSFTVIILRMSYLCIYSAAEQASPFPPKWDRVPASLQEFPVREVQGRNVTIIDPWLYSDRLGLYKILVERTKVYFADWGFNNTGNVLWGLPLQFGWQMTSGRLDDMSSPNPHPQGYGTVRVSPMSWWADMNYFLSVLPFLGALNSGILDPLKFPVFISKPTNASAELRDRFCTSVTECKSRHPEVIKKWTEFFAFLHDAGNDWYMTRSSYREKKDKTMAYLWSAHTTSLHEANPIFKDHLALLSTPEMHFGRGWAQLVDFIAACHFQTNLNNTHAQQTIALPQRILKSGDYPPFIPDFTKKQNIALEIINLQYDAQQMTKGGLLYVWQKAMCSEKGRADGRDVLENLLEHPIRLAEDLIKLVVDFAKDHDC